MKTLYKTLIALLAAVVIFSCEKPEIEVVHLKVYTQYITFNSTADSESVTMEAAQKPSVQTPSWVKATVKKEEGKDVIWTMTLSCTENKTASERKGAVIVTCLDETASINITQKKGQKQEENNEDDKKEEDEDKPEPQDTPESILLAVQETYTAESWSETESDITVVFHEPHPIELVKDYPEGIQSVTVAKTDVKKFSASDECLEFVFVSGETATITLYKAPQDTPESMLLALQNNYRLYSVMETENDITVVFHEPAPVTLNQEYPDGIKEITVSRNDLESFTDNLVSVVFGFRSGKSATIKAADIPISVTFDKDLVELQCSDPETFEWNSTTVDFTLTCCRPEKVKVEAMDMWELIINYPEGPVTMHLVQPTVTMHEGNTSGTLTVTALNNTDKTDKIKITVSNGIKSKEQYINYELTETFYGVTEEQIKAGLTALYNACNGPAWEKQNNWLTDAPIREWEGVTYASYTPFNDETGRNVMVFGIELCDANIKGVIPDEFWDICPYASKIAIDGGADLSGSTMPEKAWGKYLQKVWLQDTRIKADINHAKQCQILADVLMLGCNLEPLTAEFFISSYPFLERLYLTFANPSPLPANIGNLAEGSPYLEVLLLENLQGECPESVFSITQLKELWLTSARLTGDIPPSVGQMKNITQMVLGLYSKSGKIPNELGNCKKLTRIGLPLSLTEYPESIKYIPAGWNMSGYSPWSNLGEYHQMDLEGNEYDLEMPDWYAERYGVTYWSQGHKKHPVWPNADDLEHPADEIFWVDGQWQHRPDMKYTE